MNGYAVDRYFLGLGVIAAILGMVMGIVMGIREDFTLTPVHAHLNLLGWVTLALFGLAYRADLARKDGWAVVHFWVAAIATVVTPIGIYLAAVDQQPAVAIVGSLLTLTSMLLFLMNYLRRG